MPRILHFADAHIDIANYGRHDPESGLPLRVVDFLKALDTIIDTAIDEQVELVMFAGDAYKDRNPAPTFQREWGRRIMRLSRAGILTLLLIGNHDLSPALGRAHALDPFITLEVPHIAVLDKPAFLTPDSLEGLPLQVLALPWVSRSGLMAHLGMRGAESGQVYQELEERLTELVQAWLGDANPDLPTIMMAHASVQGAVFGNERTVMLGSDMVLPGSLVRDPRLDYVALGHIHKPQNLNEGGHPPVIYPGSIERVDFGEAQDEKFFILADVRKGVSKVEWRKLEGRRYVDRYVKLDSSQDVTHRLLAGLPHASELEGAVVRLVVDYPREWEALIDDSALHEYTAGAFEFHLIKRPQVDTRIRIPEGQAVGSLTPLELLETYWSASHIEPAEQKELAQLAQGVMNPLHASDGPER